ncbi:hypothetical protein H6P81_018111 [Aristolochia fimbriata]|uniref:Retrotransposon gag domain-containing protein n=1 Tax=Aristolochia fimbriata TaxID=158543 RepID=A0AAV7E4D0_ARIFI|nr:hypothetical protein H6P81_018111 [Aristolochia fimbriata]
MQWELLRYIQSWRPTDFYDLATEAHNMENLKEERGEETSLSADPRKKGKATAATAPKDMKEKTKTSFATNAFEPIKVGSKEIEKGDADADCSHGFISSSEIDFQNILSIQSQKCLGRELDSQRLLSSLKFLKSFLSTVFKFITRSRVESPQEIDPERERALRQRLKENQNQSTPKDQEDMENIEGTHEEQAQRPRRTMEDYVTQSPNTNRTSIITPTVQVNNFDLKPQLIVMLQTHYQFSGLANEDPNDHLERFLDLCATFKYNGVSDDAARLRLFKFTLAGRAKTWLNTLPAGSIATWEDLQKKFLGKYFPPANTIKLRNEIFQFMQEQEEHLSEAWERFNGLLKRCPNHKIELWSQIEIFYNGLNINTRSMVDVASGGSISKKTPEEVHELIKEMTANMYQYPIERLGKKAAGIYKLDSSTTTQEQLEALQNQFTNFQQQSNSMVASICGICGGGHTDTECQGNVYALNSTPEQTNFVGN